jgi:CheY-like chemotaxis protein
MPPKPLSDLTIVIVEDHDDTRKSIGSYLDQLGANVLGASNAFEGLEVIKNNRPDLVLCDIQMPGGDGFELVREIRLLDSGGSVPVIAMAAFFDACGPGTDTECGLSDLSVQAVHSK